MFTVRYADKYEYGYPCYVVVRDGKDHSKFYSGAAAEEKAARYNAQADADALAAHEFACGC